MQLGGVPFLVEAPFLEETAVVPGTAVVEMTRLLLQGSWLVAVTPCLAPVLTGIYESADTRSCGLVSCRNAATPST